MRVVWQAIWVIELALLSGCATAPVWQPTKASYEVPWRSGDPELQARVERSRAFFEKMRFDTFDMRGKTIVDAADRIKEEMVRQDFTVNMTMLLRDNTTNNVSNGDFPFNSNKDPNNSFVVFDFVLKGATMIEVLNTICEKQDMVWGLAPRIYIVPKENRENIENRRWP